MYLVLSVHLNGLATFQVLKNAWLPLDWTVRLSRVSKHFPETRTVTTLDFTGPMASAGLRSCKDKTACIMQM